MVEKLNLDEEQVAQIRELLGEGFQAQRENGRARFDLMKEAFPNAFGGGPGGGQNGGGQNGGGERSNSGGGPGGAAAVAARTCAIRPSGKPCRNSWSSRKSRPRWMTSRPRRRRSRSSSRPR